MRQPPNWRLMERNDNLLLEMIIKKDIYFKTIYLEVFDSDGTMIIDGPKNDGGPGTEESIEWACAQDNVYYVNIRSTNSNFGENVKYAL